MADDTESSTDDAESSTDDTDSRAQMIGINHVALEVGDLEEALTFYREVFAVEIRGRTESGLFLDIGDQFLALSESDGDAPDDHRHFGLVVDDPGAVERRLEAVGVETLPGRGLDFRDPWGNRIQIVGYEEIQFTKADHVARGMGIEGLEKSASANEELRAKGMSPDESGKSGRDEE